MNIKDMTVGDWITYLGKLNPSAILQIECDARTYPVLCVSQHADEGSPVLLVAETPLETQYQALLKCNQRNATLRVEAAVARGEITLPVTSVKEARRLAHISTFGAVEAKEEAA